MQILHKQFFERLLHGTLLIMIKYYFRVNGKQGRLGHKIQHLHIRLSSSFAILIETFNSLLPLKNCNQ